MGENSFSQPYNRTLGAFVVGCFIGNPLKGTSGVVIIVDYSRDYTVVNGV